MNILMPLYLLIPFFAGICMIHQCQPEVSYYNEQYRPQYHFSPEEMWMNDPNGMVYYDNEFHLFYQYHPESMVWGPMHWGHAVSRDLITWEHLPIALYPDSLGTIFSGSAVVDKQNTSGFQTGPEESIVAIFTHNQSMDVLYGYTGKPGQHQSIAYSNDKGRTWMKFEDNPVIANPGVRDFRDPKVIWHSETRKWIMVLASGDHIKFYSSPDLKEWNLESEFGQDAGAHGGVWECPDLFPLPLEEDPEIEKWILIVSLSSGAPNGGSGTQYFVGEFDGHIFQNESTRINWIDYGADNYAGVTWSNVEDRTLFMGWMSNWVYAEHVPTSPWRGSMTLPRELSLSYVNDDYLVKSKPVEEIADYKEQLLSRMDVDLNEDGEIFHFPDGEISSSEMEMVIQTDSVAELLVKISNDMDQYLIIGFNKSSGELYMDRTRAGQSNFHDEFSNKIHTVTVPVNMDPVNVLLYLDRSSVELFFNNGQYVMTELVFPDKEYNTLQVSVENGSGNLEEISISAIHSVWSQ